MSNFMKKPNIIVHLDVSPEESLRRIRMRERGCESGITLEYLQGLHAAYEEFIEDIARVIPVIKVNYSQFRTADEMADKIHEEYMKIANIRTVEFPVSPTKSKASAEEPAKIADKVAELAVTSKEGAARDAPVDLVEPATAEAGGEN